MTPNMASALGIVFAALTGLAFFLGFRVSRWFFLATPPLFVLRLIANVLDGVLAREQGLANARGEALNEGCDIVGDCMTYVPIALAAPTSVVRTMVFLIIVAMLLAEFTGVLAKLTTGTRRYDGPMGGKGDRWFWFGLGGTVIAIAPDAIAYAPAYLAVVLGFVAVTWCNRLRLLWMAL
jgi:CDP-diacylglycerol--glycerol-3-phosphate 3-phosphatidyltransferase